MRSETPIITGVGDRFGIAVPELTRHVTVAFGQVVAQQLERGSKRVVFDARSTGYIDSYGLGAIVRCAKQCREAGAKFVVVGLNEDLANLFALTSLHTVVATYTDSEFQAALAAGAL
jgi:anti-sigma B factor antagonist